MTIITKIADFTTSIYVVWYYMAMFTIVIMVGIANHPAHAGADIFPESDCNTPPSPKPIVYPINIIK